MLKSRQNVIGVDFSPAGNAAIAEAHRISKLAHMPITAVHALERSASCAMHEGYVHHQTNIHDEKVNKHRAKWEEIVAGLEAGGPINCVASKHSPADALLEQAAPC